MGFDEDLADRVRELVGDGPGLREQPMFGGLAFLVNGNMAIAASGHGGILVRIDPKDADGLATSPGAEEVVMGGRRIRGWLRVAPEYLRTKPQVATWVRRGVAWARSLPAKGEGPSPPGRPKSQLTGRTSGGRSSRRRGNSTS